MRSSQRIPATPLERYSDIRSRILNGDVLMYRGRSPLSRLVRWVTRSPYSHAGLASWWNDRLMVMEAVGRGVVVTLLSDNVGTYNGRVEWFSCVTPINPSTREAMIRFAQAELGKEYGTWNALLLGLRLLFKRGIEQRDTLRRERRLFCSHYVAQVYNVAGMDLAEGISDRFMSPGDIARATLLRRVAVLKTSR